MKEIKEKTKEQLKKEFRLKTLGRLLKSFRVKMGYDLDTACDGMHLNISRNTLISYETGRCEPNIEMLIKFSILYKRSLEEIVGYNPKEVEYNLEPFKFTKNRLIEINEQHKFINLNNYKDQKEALRIIQGRYLETLDADCLNKMPKKKRDAILKDREKFGELLSSRIPSYDDDR